MRLWDFKAWSRESQLHSNLLTHETQSLRVPCSLPHAPSFSKLAHNGQAVKGNVERKGECNARLEV